MNALTISPSPRWVLLVATALAAAVAPVIFGGGLWMVWAMAMGLLVLLLVLDGVMSPWRRHVEWDLQVPGHVAVGVETPATLDWRARAGRAGRVRVMLEASAELGAATEEMARLGLQPATLDLPLRPTRRGEWRIHAVWVQYAGPMGLARRTYRLEVDAPVQVVPDVQAVRSMALAFCSLREWQSGLKIERYAGTGSEFHAMRYHVPGMDLQTVDWKASARHRRLMSREFRAERNHHIVLAVDTGRLMAEEIDGLPRLDHAIHAALLLGMMSLRSGDRVSLFSFAATGGRLSAEHAGSGAFASLRSLTTHLAYGAEETNFTLSLTTLQAALTRRSLVVILTDFVDTVAAELMTQNLVRLCRRHLVVFAALRNPLLGDALEREPKRFRDVERSVVADGLIRDRSVVFRALSRAGILVVDGAPRDVGAGLLHRYLEVKRREMV
jgi:uncharacterized protein (DUF58 family)